MYAIGDASDLSYDERASSASQMNVLAQQGCLVRSRMEEVAKAFVGFTSPPARLIGCDSRLS